MDLFVIAAAKITVILLMLSMGLRMSWQSLTLLWRRPRLLLGSLAAALVVVPALTYLVFQLIPLSFAARAGLWVLAIAPGAPMIHTAASRRSACNADLAASFQVTVALLVIVFAPLWLLLVGAFTGLDYRMSPLKVLGQVSQVQLIPILLGLLLHHRWPQAAERAGAMIKKTSMIALLVLLLIILAFLAPRILSGVAIRELLAAALVAASALGAGHVLTGPDTATRATIATANSQRNIGLALAIASWNLPYEQEGAAIVIVLYALTAGILQLVYSAIYARRAREEP